MINSSNLRLFPLANGTPDNDSDPIGGSVDFAGGPWIPGTDSFFNSAFISASESKTLYNAAAWELDNAVTDTLTSPKLVQRNGLEPNSSNGVISIRSTSPSDSLTLVVCGDVGGVTSTEEISAEGTDTVVGSNTFEANSIVWVEASGTPIGNITVACGSQIIGVMYGTGSGAGVSQLNSLVDLAIATAKNTELSWGSDNNRLTPPDGNVDAFSRATSWSGNDRGIILPAPIVAGDYHQFAVRLTLPEGMPLPTYSGSVHIGVMLTGLVEA